jgi:predicted DNA-binding transcriptional regulator AlpA
MPLTLSQVAALAGVGQRTIERRLARGDGPQGARKFAGAWAFDASATAAWIADAKQRGALPA